MKILELRQKPKTELNELLLEKRAKLAELRFLLYQKKAKNVKELSVIRKDIARILTLLKE